MGIVSPEPLSTAVLVMELPLCILAVRVCFVFLEFKWKLKGNNDSLNASQQDKGDHPYTRVVILLTSRANIEYCIPVDFFYQTCEHSLRTVRLNVGRVPSEIITPPV